MYTSAKHVHSDILKHEPAIVFAAPQISDMTQK